jgi:hypothetical protein
VTTFVQEIGEDTVLESRSENLKTAYVTTNVVFQGKRELVSVQSGLLNNFQGCYLKEKFI